MARSIKLGVNIDHVATLRQVRLSKEPDPILAAQIAELAGADSIVCHLREDRRHIQERDVYLLKESIKTHLNLEMASSEEIIQIAKKVTPYQVTIVPERRQELTTEGGLNVSANTELYKRIIDEFGSEGIRVSFFIDPEIEQIEAVKSVGGDIIELHTGSYAEAKTEEDKLRELNKLMKAAKFAQNLGFFVAAGHGLNYSNVVEIARIPEVMELNIGYSIVCRAIFTGFYEAVRQMKDIISKSL